MKLGEWLQEHGFNPIGDKKKPDWQHAETNKVYNTSQAQMMVWEQQSPGLRAKLIQGMREHAQRIKTAGKVYGGGKTRVEASGKTSHQSE
jgi:hypothetical protein